MPSREPSDGRGRCAGPGRAPGWPRRHVVVLTGAGISTDSGIPDFRGPNGVWTKNPAAERTATLAHYLSDPEVRRAAWQHRLQSPAWDARPNAGHRAIVELERQGRLDAVITQNIDELHQQAGLDAARVIEVHGTMRRYQCWECGAGGPMEEMLERVRAGEDDPAVRRLRRHREVGHDLVRAGARAGGHRGGDGCRGAGRPAAGRRLEPAGVPGGQRRAPGQGRRRAGSSSSTASRRRWTASPTRS